TGEEGLSQKNFPVQRNFKKAQKPADPHLQAMFFLFSYPTESMHSPLYPAGKTAERYNGRKVSGPESNPIRHHRQNKMKAQTSKSLPVNILTFCCTLVILFLVL